MKKILLGLFACLLVIVPVCFAADEPEGKAKIYVMQDGVCSLGTNKNAGLIFYINGLLICDLLPNNYIYFEVNPGQNVIAFSDGNKYLDVDVDAKASETYYIKSKYGLCVFPKVGGNQKYAKSLNLMDKSEGEQLLNKIKQINPNPINKLTRVK